jgi:hypothetical protein
MESSIISDVRTQALKEGLADGMELCRKMLCKSLGQEFDSFGSALGHLDIMIIKMERMKREQSSIDE